MYRCALFISLCISFATGLVAQTSGNSPVSGTQADTAVVTLAPVVVTPTQAIERLTPVTFSNLNQAAIAERYSVQDVPVLLSDLPSSTFHSENGNGIGYNYLRLRGFDQRRISVMVNGIPQNDPEDHNVYWLDFPDLTGSTSNIQVQRGAGSAFYGPPAIGGSINMVTNPFTTTPNVTLESVLGFQQLGETHSATMPVTARKMAVSVNTGLLEGHYMVYGRVGQIQSEGYRQQSWANMNSFFVGAMRIDRDMTTRVQFYGGPIRDGLAYEGLPKFMQGDVNARRQNFSYWYYDSTGFVGATRRPEEKEGFSQPHVELMNEWRLDPTVTLSNTVFYVEGDGYFDYDGTWADTSMLRIGYNYGIPTTANPTNTIIRGFVGNKQVGWLPRLQLLMGSNSLTLGAELRFHRSTHWGKIQYADGLPASLDPEYHFYEYNGSKDIYSVYAHDLLSLDDRTTVMADLQVISNRYGIANEKYLGNNFTYPYLFVNPRVGINRNFTEALNGYVSAAYTSREPVLRNLYAAEDSYFGATPQFHADTTGGVTRYDFNRPFAKPERLIDLEAGMKISIAGFTFAENAYWMEFTDELVKNGTLDIFGQPVTGNAERTRHIGMEFEGSFDLFSSLTVAGNVTGSSNRLVHFRVYDESSGAWVTLDNNPIAGFPDRLGNLRVTYHPAAFTAGVSVKYVGSFYTDNTANAANMNDSYTVVNAELLYPLPVIAGARFTVRAEVNNLLNNLYFYTGEGASFYPAAERNFILGLTAKF